MSGSGAEGPPRSFALRGRVVTMDANDTVIDQGAVYVRDGIITAVSAASEAPPVGFEGTPVVATGGTIYPGLIELHNHLSYDALPLWAVPKKFTNRDQWGSGGSNAATYRKLISGPMNVLGKSPDLSAAIARFVECKAMAGGVTTSQGIALFSNAGIPRYYQGVLRNVEQPNDTKLPAARGRIGDVAAEDAQKFLAELERRKCLLLHLSEGTDEAARQHFLSLQLSKDTWAIRPSLAGIHSVALGTEGLDVMAHRGASVVWSPLSNLLLYGDTLDIDAAKASHVRMGIGSDWSPSGSKNLFGELKVARLVSQSKGGVFSDAELLAMATRNAANILGWDALLGSVEPGKYADLTVLAGLHGDPYETFLDARETAIVLVVIQGIPRYGRTGLMGDLGVGTAGEALTVGSAERTLWLKDPAADSIVKGLSFGEAQGRLADALANLPQLAKELEQPSPAMALAAIDTAEPRWFLQLDHDESQGFALRPHLPGPDGVPTALAPANLAALAAPLSTVLEPIELDALTVADDPGFLERIAAEPNVPEEVRTGLPGLYT